MYLYWDPSYILVLIGALICGIASIGVRTTFKKFSKVRNVRNLTAEYVAENILHSAGIYDVKIERVRGNLSDHYSPKEKVLRLSDSVYGSTSVAAVGVAAHECGHAIQHKVGYAPLKLRSASVPIANIGSWLCWPVLILGLILSRPEIAQLGVFLFSFVVLFQLITVPVELNASRRAMKVLEENNILADGELSGARKVLTSAAMTYVAALFSAILQLLRIVLIANGGSNRRK